MSGFPGAGSAAYLPPYIGTPSVRERQHEALAKMQADHDERVKHHERMGRRWVAISYLAVLCAAALVIYGVSLL